MESTYSCYKNIKQTIDAYSYVPLIRIYRTTQIALVSFPFWGENQSRDSCSYVPDSYEKLENEYERANIFIIFSLLVGHWLESLDKSLTYQS